MSAELRQLRHFVAVAEELHFGRAATRLHMSQPPLSQSILNLEAELGQALFIRTKRSVQLSAAGQALLPQARRLLQDAAQLPELVQRAASGNSGRLSLAFISNATYSLLPTLLAQFRQRYPQVSITLKEATSDVQFDDLQQGRIDAGFVIPPLPASSASSSNDEEELSWRPLLREPLLLALPSALAAQFTQRPLPLAHLGQQPLIIFPRHIAPKFHDQILACFVEAGLTPSITQEAIQMQTIVSLVSAQMGIALVPQSVSNLQRTGVEYVALAGPVPMLETGLAWRKDNASPVLRAFLGVLAGLVTGT